MDLDSLDSSADKARIPNPTKRTKYLRGVSQFASQAKSMRIPTVYSSLNSLNNEVIKLLSSTPPELSLSAESAAQLTQVLNQVHFSLKTLSLQLSLHTSDFCLPHLQFDERLRMTSEDLRSMHAFRLEHQIKLIQDELCSWKGYMKDRSESFSDRVNTSLKKYLSFAYQHFPTQPFTAELAQFKQRWVALYCESEESEGLEALFSSNALVCTNCQAYQAQLDLFEIQQINDNDSYQKQLNTLRSQLIQATTELKPVPEYAGIYQEYFLKVANDVENILGAELPQMLGQPEAELPKVWMEIRKALGMANKRARNKTMDKSEKEFYQCTVQQLKDLCTELTEVIEDFEVERVFKARLGPDQLTIKVTEDLTSPQPAGPLPDFIHFTEEKLAEAFKNSFYDEDTQPIRERRVPEYRVQHSSNPETVQDLERELAWAKTQRAEALLQLGEEKTVSSNLQSRVDQIQSGLTKVWGVVKNLGNLQPMKIQPPRNV